jgi:hypothetical protein
MIAIYGVTIMIATGLVIAKIVPIHMVLSNAHNATGWLKTGRNGTRISIVQNAPMPPILQHAKIVAN